MVVEALTKEKLSALADKRFQVSGSRDVDTTMSLLIGEPVYEIYPIGLRLAGQENVRRYYEYMFSHVTPTISAEHLDTFFADNSIAFELKLTHQPSSGDSESFRLFSIMDVIGDRFVGERLYGDERLFRIFFGGPIWSLMKPIEG